MMRLGSWRDRVVATILLGAAFAAAPLFAFEKLISLDLSQTPEDPRHDLIKSDRLLLEWQRAPLVRTRAQVSSASDYWTLTTFAAAPHLSLCLGESFANQPLVERPCTGMMITNRLLLTARHCVGQTPAGQLLAVFGFRVIRGGFIPKTFTDESVIPVRAVWAAKHESSPGDEYDWAALELERDSPARYATRADQVPNSGTRVDAVGYPSGLPAKYVFQGTRIVGRSAVTKRSFKISRPAYVGTSGSPVLEGGRLVGMLVGKDAFSYHLTSQNCAARTLRAANAASTTNERVLFIKPIVRDLRKMGALREGAHQEPMASLPR